MNAYLVDITVRVVADSPEEARDYAEEQATRMEDSARVDDLSFDVVEIGEPDPVDPE